jgi:hypothetical protein
MSNNTLRDIATFRFPHRLWKKSFGCHSERRFCAKNPSQAFVLNQEGFFAFACLPQAGSE